MARRVRETERFEGTPSGSVGDQLEVLMQQQVAPSAEQIEALLIRFMDEAWRRNISAATKKGLKEKRARCRPCK